MLLISDHVPHVYFASSLVADASWTLCQKGDGSEQQKLLLVNLIMGLSAAEDIFISMEYSVIIKNLHIQC